MIYFSQTNLFEHFKQLHIEGRVFSPSPRETRQLTLSFMAPGNEASRELRDLFTLSPLIVTNTLEAENQFKSLYPNARILQTDYEAYDHVISQIDALYSQAPFADLLLDLSEVEFTYNKKYLDFILYHKLGRWSEDKTEVNLIIAMPQFPRDVLKEITEQVLEKRGVWWYQVWQEGKQIYSFNPDLSQKPIKIGEVV